MADRSRIEELRLRLQKDPGSIAFAQLAEEYRREGRYRDAIQACQAGLARHPGYLSARVTLGRALIEVGDLDGAHRELTAVFRLAPENLSAIRGLAEVHRKRGELPEALAHFKTAFELAGKDPAVEDAVRTLRRDAAAHATIPAPADRPVPPMPRASEDPRARRMTAYLSRWLEAIVADRRVRLYGARA
jgi:tetratricopeptide (TPR) repeat protein